MRIFASLLAIAFAATPAFAAEIDPDLRVVIRTYDNATFRAADLRSALETATAILGGAGVDVEWQACEAAFVRNPEHRCAAPLGGNEIAVRFVRMRTDMSSRGDLPLGYSLVDAKTRSGALATIFMDRVLWLADAAKIDARPLLGRAIAHEVGHLLLGTNAHTGTGLMRAVWSCDSLRHNNPDDWAFETRDVESMKQAIRLRAQLQLAKSFGSFESLER